MGVLRVLGVVARDQDDVGADLFGFADLGPGLDAEDLGLVAGSNAAGGVRHGGNHRQWPAPVLRVQLLFYRREEAVQVDVQEAESVGMEGIGHEAGAIIFAFYLPSIT